MRRIITAKKKGNSKKKVDEDVKQSSTVVIQNTKLKEVKEVGRGLYSIVNVGVWTQPNGQTKMVAVKCLKDVDLEEHLQDVLNNMVTLEHNNITALYGICLGPILKLVTEYAQYFSLRDAVRNESKRGFFCQVTRLKTYALQVAEGMAYLAENNLMHCNLNSSNVLVVKPDLVQISDVGLAMALFQGQGKAADRKVLDAQWCAPELQKGQELTCKVDVYGFSGLLWEMLTFGENPLEHSRNEEERLPQPKACPTEMYRLMNRCWTEHPEDRPNFDEVIPALLKIEFLEGIAKATSLRFDDTGYMLSFSKGSKITIIESLGNPRCYGQNENAEVGLVSSEVIDLKVKPRQRSIEEYDFQIGTPFDWKHTGPASLMRQLEIDEPLIIPKDPRKAQPHEEENNGFDYEGFRDYESGDYLDMNDDIDGAESFISMQNVDPRIAELHQNLSPFSDISQNGTAVTSVESTENNRPSSSEQVNQNDNKNTKASAPKPTKASPPPIPKRSDLEQTTQIMTNNIKEIQPKKESTTTLRSNRPVPKPRTKRHSNFDFPKKEKVEIRPRSKTEHADPNNVHSPIDSMLNDQPSPRGISERPSASAPTVRTPYGLTTSTAPLKSTYTPDPTGSPGCAGLHCLPGSAGSKGFAGPEVSAGLQGQIGSFRSRSPAILSRSSSPPGLAGTPDLAGPLESKCFSDPQGLGGVPGSTGLPPPPRLPDPSCTPSSGLPDLPAGLAGLPDLPAGPTGLPDLPAGPAGLPGSNNLTGPTGFAGLLVSGGSPGSTVSAGVPGQRVSVGLPAPPSSAVLPGPSVSAGLQGKTDLPYPRGQPEKTGAELLNEMLGNKTQLPLAEGLRSPTSARSTKQTSLSRTNTNELKDLNEENETSKSVKNDCASPLPQLVKGLENQSTTSRYTQAEEENSNDDKTESSIENLLLIYPNLTKDKCFKVLQVVQFAYVDEETAIRHLGHCNWKVERAIAYILDNT